MAGDNWEYWSRRGRVKYRRDAEKAAWLKANPDAEYVTERKEEGENFGEFRERVDYVNEEPAYTSEPNKSPDTSALGLKEEVNPWISSIDTQLEYWKNKVIDKDLAEVPTKTAREFFSGKHEQLKREYERKNDMAAWGKVAEVIGQAISTWVAASKGVTGLKFQPSIWDKYLDRAMEERKLEISGAREEAGMMERSKATQARGKEKRAGQRERRDEIVNKLQAKRQEVKGEIDTNKQNMRLSAIGMIAKDLEKLDKRLGAEQEKIRKILFDKKELSSEERRGMIHSIMANYISREDMEKLYKTGWAWGSDDEPIEALEKITKFFYQNRKVLRGRVIGE